jgi:hypothetical protein
MKRVTVAIAVISVFALTLGVWSPALAGTATGAVEFKPEAAITGASLVVDVSVVSETPVVAYEYALVNECYLSGKPSGRADTYQRDDIVNWNFSDGDVPHATMLVGLESIPVDAVCKVYIVRGNALVKDSLTQYTVVAYVP